MADFAGRSSTFGVEKFAVKASAVGRAPKYGKQREIGKMKPLEYFGNRLSELMFDQKQMTSEKFAEIIGVNPSTVRRWRNGTLNIKLSRAVKIADYFQCSLEFLFGFTDVQLDFCIYPAPPFYPQLMAVMKKRGVRREAFVKGAKKSHRAFDAWKGGADPTMLVVIDLARFLDCRLDVLAGRERE